MDRDEVPVDLSALDPTRDSAHLEAVVQSVVARALAARQVTVWGAAVRWWRPVLALAAAAALAVWVPTWLQRDDEVVALADSLAPGEHLERWVRTGVAPTADELLTTLGGTR